MRKVLVDRELLLFLNGEAELDGMAFGEHPPGKPFWWRKRLREALAQPAEAEGIEVVAYATPNADGDWQMLFFDEKEAMLYVEENEQPTALVTLAALSAVTAERDRLLASEVSLGKDLAESLKQQCADIRTIDQLRAEVERFRKQAALEVAVQRAAGELPDGWEICICIEKDGGGVELFDSEGDEVEYPANHERLAYDVNDAIDHALAPKEA